jgi:hypothetical protein
MFDRDVRNAVTVYALLRCALVGLDNLSDDMLIILYRSLELATEKYPDGEDAGSKAQNDVLRAFAAYVKVLFKAASKSSRTITCERPAVPKPS